MNRNLGWLAVMAAAALGCGGEGGTGGPGTSIEVSTGPLAGVVGGAAWTFRTGETDAILSTGSRLFTALYATSYGACGAAPVEAHVLVSVPAAPGDYPFSTQQTGTFVIPPTTNLVATTGRIVVTSVSATAVTARVHMIFDAANEIDGEFVASICP
jgi:hypothetical protein